MRKVLIAVLFAAIWVIPGMAAHAQGAFADVPIDHWAYESIQKLADLGCLIGYPDGMFKGQRAMTRYEAAEAIARCCEKCKGSGSGVGPKGDTGATGATGPAGQAGPGMSDEAKALLGRLETEFAPELKAIRADLDDLTRRVEELEAMPKPEAKVKVSGFLQYRQGWYGSTLKLETGETTGYPFNPSTGVGVFAVDYEYDEAPAQQYYYWGIPVTDATKDAYKASDFSSLWTQLNLTGKVSEKAQVNVSFVGEPRGNRMGNAAWDVSPNWWWGHGELDGVRIEEANVTFPMNVVVPWDFVVGKQRTAWAEGLVLDNNLLALKGVRGTAHLGRNVNLEFFESQLDREALYGQVIDEPSDPGETTMGQDTWAAARLGFPVFGWDVGVNYLHDGFRSERAASVSGAGKIFGRNVSFEVAELDTNAAAFDIDDIKAATGAGSSDAMAWLVKADVLKTPSIDLSAAYGQLGALYAFAVPFNGDGYDPWDMGIGPFNLPFSSLHPFAEVSPHDINWVDRGNHLDATNIARGWKVALTLPTLLGQGTPLTVTYADGDAISESYLNALANFDPVLGIEKWRNADSVWTVSIARPVAENVNFRLLYGQREVKNVLAYNGSVSNPPDIKVLRGELTVTF